MTVIRRVLQQSAIHLARPYIVRELPGWGRIYGLFGRNDWLWTDAPTRQIVGKLHGYGMQLDLNKWPDRAAFFLGRWYALDIQLLLMDLVQPGDTVVDVGANRGMFALTASRLVGERGRVICFEPNPSCVETLWRTAEANRISNISLHALALSDAAGELTLTVPRINSGQGTLGRLNYDPESCEEMRVRVVTGDEVLAGLRPAFVKLDVEGFEAHALRGMRRLLADSAPLVITEVIPGLLEACGSSVGDLTALMTGMGYTPAKIGLEKHRGRFRWCLHPPDTSGGGNTDWMWLHADSPTDLRQRANDRMRGI